MFEDLEFSLALFEFGDAGSELVVEVRVTALAHDRRALGHELVAVYLPLLLPEPEYIEAATQEELSLLEHLQQEMQPAHLVEAVRGLDCPRPRDPAQDEHEQAEEDEEERRFTGEPEGEERGGGVGHRGDLKKNNARS